MDDKLFADRLVNYADAVTAVSFVGMSGLSIALVDPDVRCSLVQSVPAVAIGNTVYTTIVSVLLVVLRRWESDLRSGTPLSKKSMVYSRRLHVARQVVIWFSAAAAILVVLAGTRSSGCAP